MTNKREHDALTDELLKKPLLNLSEVGLILRINKTSVYKLVKNKTLRAGKIPTMRAWFVQREDLMDLIDRSLLGGNWVK